MPIYNYICSECGHQLKILAKMSDPPETPRYLVGYEFDHTSFGENVVLASDVKFVNAEITRAMTQVTEGEFENGHFMTGLENGDVDVVMNPGFASTYGGEYRNSKAAAILGESQFMGVEQ